ncbi:hypothetical protein IHQ71_13520 [Rhizobium sp. TH2]|uniref:hypothetical protein n=1 Tax=Rhizobium sp. TH2 TaxID=2775403 RepID=UPI0021582474|nr:hypothetical protein [Rhizobium sp. TH2]UVC11500.1 hypothetical protein IHQ71_13520 [Rhizobium sp. TH2]
MRLPVAVAILLLSAPAYAAENCKAWTAAVEEDEGGPVMTARVCAGSGDIVSQLSLQCGAKGELMIRYIPVAPDNYPPAGNGNFETDLEFSLDQEMFTRHARYEDMDGAMATETEINPFISTLMIQKKVDVADVKGKVPSATFTLKGAKKALEKLIATCEK